MGDTVLYVTQNCPHQPQVRVVGVRIAEVRITGFRITEGFWIRPPSNNKKISW